MNTSAALRHDGPRDAATDAPLGILIRALARLAVVSLVVYHAWLLWDRVASLTLLDPAVALRWGAAAMLVLGLVRLQRAGVPLLSGQGALIVWLLVALLHASMAPGVGGLTATLAEADAGLWLALSLSGLLLLFGARVDASSALPKQGCPGSSTPEAVPALRAACLALLSPRPPPVACGLHLHV